MQSVWSKDYHKEMGPNTFSKAGPQILAGAVGPKAMSMSADFAEGLAGFSFNADLKEINDSFNIVKEAFSQKKISPRLITSFWFGLGDTGRNDIKIHLTRYLGWMGEDLAKNLSEIAGFSGNQNDLYNFLVEIKELGATDALLVPTSKDISQLSMAEEVVSKFNQESSD